jgi:hypothetical protein
MVVLRVWHGTPFHRGHKLRLSLAKPLGGSRFCPAITPVRLTMQLSRAQWKRTPRVNSQATEICMRRGVSTHRASTQRIIKWSMSNTLYYHRQSFRNLLLEVAIDSQAAVHKATYVSKTLQPMRGRSLIEKQQKRRRRNECCHFISNSLPA